MVPVASPSYLMPFQHFDVHERMEGSHWWFLARRDILRAVVRALLPPSKGKTVVDIGCGTGANTAMFAESYRAVGIDPGQHGIASARERFPGIEFFCGEAPGILAGLRIVPDLIVLADVLEHVQDDRAFLHAIIAALPPGSFLLVTVPADMALWSRHEESVGHCRRYTAESLRRLWSGLPVRERLVSSFNARLYPAIRAVRTWNRMFRRTSGERGTDFALPPRPVNRLLKRIFAGESNVLLDTLRGRRAKGFTYGASLITVLERV